MRNPIKTAKGNSIDYVVLPINRFASYSVQIQKDKDYAKFMRAFTNGLLSGSPDESEAGKFARELLEKSKEKIDRYSAAGRAGMAKRWGDK